MQATAASRHGAWARFLVSGYVGRGTVLSRRRFRAPPAANVEACYHRSAIMTWEPPGASGAARDGMSIISRYIFRQALGAVLMILGSLTVVIWLAVALRQLEFMASQGQTTTLFFKLTGLALPGLIAFIAPIALLIAVVHTLNRLNGDSELIVTTAGGASTWRLATPLLTLALFVACDVGDQPLFRPLGQSRAARHRARCPRRSDHTGAAGGRFTRRKPS